MDASGQDRTASLFRDRVPEAAARQLATVLAWLAESQLETLEELEGKRTTPQAVLARQRAICDKAVQQCRDLGVPPYGLWGASCARLEARLAEAAPNTASAGQGAAAVRDAIARALFEFQRNAAHSTAGARRIPAWDRQLPEFHEHMRRMADAALAALADQNGTSLHAGDALLGANRVLRLEKTPLLVSGTLGTDNSGRVRMLIDSEQPQPEQAVALFHETLHLLLAATGQQQHDEAQVDALAKRLAQCCPEIMDILRVPTRATSQAPGAPSAPRRP